MKHKKALIRVELTSRQAAVLLATGFMTAFVGYLASESLTLSTTYPSPVGIYKTMITTDQTTLGRSANNVILVPASTNPSGMVGIGTASPGAELDVAGGIHPGSTIGGSSVQTGQACSVPEGTIAYDSKSATHQLVYCNSSGVWATALGGGGTSIYKGLTSQSYAGPLGGVNGAAAKCAADYPGSRLCTASDIDSLPGPVNAGAGWIATGSIIGGSSRDCGAWYAPWTGGAGNNAFVCDRTTGCASASMVDCGQSYPLQCCM